MSNYVVWDDLEVKKHFDEIEKNLKRQVLQKALRAAINVLANAIREACPDVTGVLQGAITTKVNTSSDGLSGSAEISFGDQTLTAVRVEFGHAIWTHEPGHKDTGEVVQPHPFVWNTYEEKKAEAIAAYEAAVESALIIRS
jgi:HK97 gp10 family phage protein